MPPTLFGLFKQTTTSTAQGPTKASFTQPKETTGLLVTAQLAKALDECKLKVERIAKACRAQNRKYRDIEFDLENDKDRCLHGLQSSNTYTPSDVQRVTEIFDNPKFFVDGADSNDVVQGELGDCWFLSALATMSTAKGLVESFCVARDDKVGVYGFIFFRDTYWVTVIIDDLLYTSIPKFEELSAAEKQLYHHDKKLFNESARKGGKILYFARSGTQGETWVPLIEKAYAKLHGSYAALSGGEACEAIEDLTGGVSTFFASKDILDRDVFWKEELLKANKDRLFGCAFDGLDGSRSGVYGATVNGLFGNHAYSVLRAVEYNGKRFVVIRNPWGESEWDGPWSDGSKEWSHEWLQALPALGHTFGDDGEFVMEYDDFLSVWQQIDRTILFDSSWVLSSHWLEVTTRSLPSAWSFGDVSFTISLPAPSAAIIVLAKLDDRYFTSISGPSIWTFDFVVFKKGETEPVGSSSHSRFYSRSVNLEVDLEAGDYVVHVRLDRLVKDGYNESFPGSERKLSRALMERAKSRSIASNFKADQETANLPMSLSILAGQDLAELEQKALEAAAALRKETEELKPADTVTTTTTMTIVESTTVTETHVVLAATADEKPEQTEKAAPTNSTSDASGKSSGDSNAVSSPPLQDTEVPEDDAKGDTGSEVPDISKLSLAAADGESIFLGLSVYTNRSAPAVIGGQLRHEMEASFDGLAVQSI